MTSIMSNGVKQFRQVFPIAKVNSNWFPGHMNKGVKQMQQKLKSVDCIIEVHDARIPFSGRNPNFYHLLTAIRPHVLVLNKMDLANLRHKADIQRNLTMKWKDMNIVFANCKDDKCPGVAGLIPKAIELIKLSDRFNRAENLAYTIMIIGIPNVGKSSLINALRVRYKQKGRATPVGATPGVTRSVLYKIKVCDEPSVFILDTPGILEPNISNVDMAMRLSLCATIHNHTIGATLVADYLLYWMNKNNNFNYVSFFGLKEATDDIDDLLLHISVTNKMVRQIRTPEGERKLYPDFDMAANYLLRAFQYGKLGKFMLDTDYL